MEDDWCHFVPTYDEHHKIMWAPCSFKKVPWMTHPIYHIFFWKWWRMTSLKSYFFENTCTGFSENLVEDIKLMPNKVLKVSRWYLPSFLCYRENSGGGGRSSGSRVNVFPAIFLWWSGFIRSNLLWSGWLIRTESSAELLCITDMAGSRNSGPRPNPFPVSEIWHLVWT